MYLLLSESCPCQISALNQPHSPGLVDFFFFFSKAKGRKMHSFLPWGKKAMQKLSAVPSSYVREKLIRLLKRCFPEHLQLKLQSWKHKVAMRVFFHMDLKSLSTFAYLTPSHPHLQLTSSPSEIGNVPCASYYRFPLFSCCLMLFA